MRRSDLRSIGDESFMLKVIPQKQDIDNSRLERGKKILREEGFLPFCKQAASFILSLLFVYGKQYIYEYDLQTCGNIPDVSCQVNNMTIKSAFIPITLSEYDELAKQGADLLSHPDARNYEERLVKGVIVFYAFTGDEFLFQTAMTTSRDGLPSAYLRHYPPSMPEGHTACIGFSETVMKYRGKGISSYVYAEVFRYLRHKGISRALVLVNEDALAAHRVHEKLRAKVLCKVFLLRLLSRFEFMWIKPSSKSSLLQ